MGILEKIAEERIKKAIEEGTFDNLEGFGKPVDNSEYFNAPPDQRISWHILKNAGVVPEEVSLRRQIYDLYSSISQESDPGSILLKKERIEMLRTQLLFYIERSNKK